jgi:hypothetical protein
VRTYSKSTLRDAATAWAAVEPGPHWAPCRQAAAERGLLFPPSGYATDSPTVSRPSQRAILERAIDEAPRALLAAIRRSPNWAMVVAEVLRDRDRRVADAEAEELAAIARRRAEGIGPRTGPGEWAQAATVAAGIVARVRRP